MAVSQTGGGGVGGGGGGDACVHDVCASGVALTSGCDACATQICAADSYCCKTSWNARCVSEVATVCGITCGAGGGGTGGGGTGGGGTGGTGGGGGIGGGTGGLLKFAVFGDCRPPNSNDTSGYPSAIIGGIFTLAQSNGAQFMIGTGDYMFADTSSAVTAQVALFKQAMAHYSAGPVYLAMGNHECTGATASNCPEPERDAERAGVHADGAVGRDQALLPRRHRTRRSARPSSCSSPPTRGTRRSSRG